MNIRFQYKIVSEQNSVTQVHINVLTWTLMFHDFGHKKMFEGKTFQQDINKALEVISFSQYSHIFPYAHDIGTSLNIYDNLKWGLFSFK